jgi:thymidine kinase
MCEYRKQSEIIITAKNRKGILNQVLLMLNLLKKSDLNIKEIIYHNNSDEKENYEIIEKVKDISKINYRIIE